MDLYKCNSCNKNKRMYCTCHKCDKIACESCAESGSMTWIAVPWINDSGLPVSFCMECIDSVQKVVNASKVKEKEANRRTAKVVDRLTTCPRSEGVFSVADACL